MTLCARKDAVGSSSSDTRQNSGLATTKMNRDTVCFETKKKKGEADNRKKGELAVPARKRIRQSRYAGTLPDHITPLCLPA